ncbi:Glutamate racemase [Elusimicrobium minutum Pei191]|uniref:Glutamate racemase n=1 Tax=Elusimicrobium minutum (strain Pei191) TaxID=445932 RepID=B2KBT5_ELUMP|nr:glutamate racemase [Elusimicrobium minutum]ACC97839.1 Glutamate racemase [Elusimicrobium minutum Pei191]
MNNKPIGIFDSGLGGLTILRALQNDLPKENFIYFGDSARVPYGSKSKSTVLQYSLEIAKFLETQNIKFLVVACNTASAFALEALKKELSIPVFGVIEAGAYAAVTKTKNKKVAVIGTSGTVSSGSYKKVINAFDKKVKVFEIATPLFVPFIEEGWADTRAAKLVAEEYLSAVKKSGSDTLILGCTHYPIIKTLIKKIMGSKVNLIDSAETISKATAGFLKSKDMLKTKGSGSVKIYASDAPDLFAKKAGAILKSKIKKVYLHKF